MIKTNNITGSSIVESCMPNGLNGGFIIDESLIEIPNFDNPDDKQEFKEII